MTKCLFLNNLQSELTFKDEYLCFQFIQIFIVVNFVILINNILSVSHTTLMIKKLKTEISAILAEEAQYIDFDINDQLPSGSKLERRASFGHNNRSPQIRMKKNISYKITEGQNKYPGNQDDTNSQYSQYSQYSHYSQLITALQSQVKTLQQEKLHAQKQAAVNKTLRDEVEFENSHLVEEIRRITTYNTALQTEKLKLVSEFSQSGTKIASYQGTLLLNEERIYNLERQNKRLIDELNFEKQLCSDYKNENTQLKIHIKNLSDSLQSSIADLNLTSHISQLKSEFINRYNQLRTSMGKLHSQINDLTVIGQQNTEYNSELRNYIQNLQTNNEDFNIRRQIQSKKIKRQGLTQISSSGNNSDKQECIKTIRKQQRKIKELSSELLTKKDREMCSVTNYFNELFPNKQNTQNTQLSAPKYHSSSKYLTKVVRDTHQQVNHLRKISGDHQDQIERLTENLNLQINNSNRKSEEIDRLTILMRNSEQMFQLKILDELQGLKLEKQRLQRKVQDLMNNTKSLKIDIAEKDRIIMVHVNKNRNNKQ